MSVLLFIAGAIVVMLGVAMIGYGIPINEFTFGNTLIVGGTTAVVGGLIIIAIGVAVGQLRRINQALRAQMTVRSSLPAEMPEPGPAPSPVPFPPRPKSEPAIAQAQPPSEPEHPPAAAAPMLRNPDRPPAGVEEFKVEEYEAVSLTPQRPMPAPAPPPAEPAEPEEPRSPISDDVFPFAGLRSEAPFDAPWHSSPPPERQSQPSYFDAMWPAEIRPAKAPAVEEAKPEPKPSVPPPSEPPSKPVAILKSGVVDGMAYTLYVDGSIEAELPDGTLHFASINELRDHLARNS